MGMHKVHPHNSIFVLVHLLSPNAARIYIKISLRCRIFIALFLDSQLSRDESAASLVDTLKGGLSQAPMFVSSHKKTTVARQVFQSA